MSQGSKRVSVAEDCEPGESRGRGGQKGPALQGLVGFDSVCGGNRWRISSREVM